MKLSEIGKSSICKLEVKPQFTLEPKVINKNLPKLTTERQYWDGEDIFTKDIKEFKYVFEKLNPVQSEFFVNRYLDANFVVCARTSAGKTVIAELARNGKMLYLSPLKAISQEKRDDWTSDGHAWSNLRISISTGDYQLTSDRVQEMREADVIVMTSEMLDSRSRNMALEKNDWLKQIDTLVIDEFHLIGYKGRGDKLESAIIRFTEQNPNCRLICLSATMPNVTELATWLTKLNGKKTIIINSDYRPVELYRHYETYVSSSDYGTNEAIKASVAKRIVMNNLNDKFIVFVHTKNTGNQLLDSFKYEGVKAEFHNADLNKEDRSSIQAQFNSTTKGSLRVLIATSTLAWGVNTPADSVIITGLHRGRLPIENQDIHQMCGRAGRIGKSSKGRGDAYIIIPQKDSEQYIEWCEKILDVKSRLDVNSEGGLATLCFHVIAEIMGGFIKDGEDLLKWYERSLARHQNIELTLDDANSILSKLEQIKMVRKNDDGTYYVTGLGKVSGNLYYDPFSIYAWYRNFNILLNTSNVSDIGLSWALGNIDGFDMGYIPQNTLNEVNKWLSLSQSQNLNAGNTAHICTTFYHLLQGTEPFPISLLLYKRSLQSDFDRASLALSMIDALYGRWKQEELWQQLKWRVKYGVPTYLLDLVKLPQIGKIRAERLYKNGIKTKEDFIKKASTARGIITSSLYDKIISLLN